MSSYSSSKGKGKSKGSSQRSEQSEWSGWVWDQANYQYYRTRLRSNGEYDYEYRAPDSKTPRSEANSAPVAPYISGSSAGSDSSQYYQSREYGYSPGNSTTSPMDTLADDFSSKATIGSSNSSIPYNSSELYGSSSSSSNYYPGTSWGPSGSVVATAGGRSFSSSSIGGGYGMAGSAPLNSVGYDQAALPQPTSASFGTSSSVGFYNPPIPPTSQQLPSVAEQGSSGALTPTHPRHISGSSGTVGDSEELDPRFKIHNSTHWETGKVFKILWSEPQGETAYSNNSVYTKTTVALRFGEKVYQSIRRFVIVRTGHGHSSCVAISTFQHRGASKSGINKDDHAFAYMGDKLPKNLPKHAAGLKNAPVLIKGNSPREKLHPDSCINVAKIYNVEHNVKVVFIGRLTTSSEKNILFAVNKAWNESTSSGS